MVKTVGRMLNTHTHTHTQKVNPMPTNFSPIPILPALKFYTAPFSPTLAVVLCPFKLSGYLFLIVKLFHFYLTLNLYILLK